MVFRNIMLGCSELKEFADSINIEALVSIMSRKRYKFFEEAHEKVKHIEWCKSFSDFALWLSIFFNERGFWGCEAEATEEKKVKVKITYLSLEGNNPMRVIILDSKFQPISTYRCMERSRGGEDTSTIEYDNKYPAEIMKGIEKAKMCMGVIAYL